MNSLDERQLGTHVQILGWLRIGSALLLAVVGIGLLMLLGGIGVFASTTSEDVIPFWVLGITGFLLAAFMVVLALPGFIAGVGLLKRKSWGRILTIIVAVFDLLNFPIGTAIAVYSFYVLFQNAADAYFTGSSPGRAIQEVPQGQAS
jgi:hypothetical protein